jgi:putative mRNA 3-end processing factor
MSIGKVFTHSAIENINDTIRRQSIKLPPTIRVQPDMKKKRLVAHVSASKLLVAH